MGITLGNRQPVKADRFAAGHGTIMPGVCRRTAIFRLSAMLLVLFSCLFAAAVATAAPPAAGSMLENRATASFRDDTLDLFVRIASNQVQTTVLPLEALTLTSDHTVNLSAGAPVTFTHRLTNTGNTTSTYTLNLTQTAGSDFTLTGLMLHQDLNTNGIVEANDLRIISGSALILKAGESADLLISGNIPWTTPVNLTSTATLDVKTALQGVTAVNTDRIKSIASAVIDIVKQSSVQTPKQGEAVTFSLLGTSNGGSSAYPVGLANNKPITIDGAPAQIILMRDVIPANTTYVPGSLTSSSGASLLYHRTGDSTFSYLSVEPQSVDEIGCGVPLLDVGGTVQLSFQVKINPNASGTVNNAANVYYNNGDPSGASVGTSNNVVLPLPLIPIKIRYYSDNTFTRETAITRIDQPLYLQADAAQCNSDPLTADLRTISVTSALTGDVEIYTALETGANTGQFRILPNVPMHDGKLNPTVHGNGIVEALKDDLLTASIDGCGASSATTEIFIDPVGVVFDSHSNEPVANAEVTIYDVTGNGRSGANLGVPGPAEVFAYDTVTPLPSRVVTLADGKFEFPLVRASSYRIDVVAPAGYHFISKLARNVMPADRNIDDIRSYNGVFPINTTTGAVRVDIPVDPVPMDGLFIEKRASASVAEIGDFITYSVQVKNGAGRQIKKVVLDDQLPAGFSYVSGSARLDGAALTDPSGGSGPQLEFNIGNIDNNKTLTVSYRVKIGVLATHGDGINRAQAKAAYGTVSNLATAFVKVVGGVFSDKGYIIGKIFVDCNRNRIQDPEELGIPGVRIYLEDGSFVISDSEGKYSFYGLRPRTHVLVLDDTTLPSGSELIDLSNRNAGDAASRFVDLKNSELHKANFAEGSCSEDILRQVKARRAQGQVFVAESERTLAGRLSLDLVPLPPSEPKALPSSGLIGGEIKVPNYTSPAPVLTTNAPVTAVAPLPELSPTDVKATPVELAERVASLDTTAAILEPLDGAILPANQTVVVVKGRSGGELKLTVNGKVISDKQVGKKVIDSERHLEAREYIGINLKPGENELVLEVIDPFGNNRGSNSVKVIAPDVLAKISIVVPEADIPADGHTPVKVQVRLIDDKGVPVTSRTYITLESSLGRWQVKDFNDTEPGIQNAIEGGSGEFVLLAPQEPGNARIRITSAGIKSEAVVSFIPELRPMIAAGLIEGIINVRKSGMIGLSPTRSQDGFDQELHSFSKTSDDGRMQAASREAVFLKGKIKGDYLLTLAYDSDKDTKERLFRDIQPDEFYPVYGDSSIRGFDAQSTGKLYVRIDKNKSYLLLGDYSTSQATEARSLGAYNRSVTGLKYHLENKDVSANVYGSQDSMKQVIEELPAMGISGPYYLKNGTMVVNSEQVEIITRDRNQPSLILKKVIQTRFSDYEIEPFTGRIIFKSPIPTLDPDLNPNFIKVSYELDQGGKKFLVAGADGQLKITDRWEAGGAFVRDNNPSNRVTLMSVNTTLKLDEKSFLIAEVAQSETDAAGKGDARRVELRHESGPLKLIAKAILTDNNFDNPNSATGKGRLDASANVDYRVTSSTVLKGEIIHSEDRITGGIRDGAMVNLEENLAENAKIEIGLRQSHETTLPSQPASSGISYDLTSARAKLSSPAPYLPNLAGYGEYEQALDTSNRKMAALGADYKVAEKTRLYARHQFISSLTGPYGLNSSQQQNATLFGIDSEYMRDGHAFSEYRVRDAINDRESEAAVGLRNGWEVARGVKLSTGLERIQTLNGAANNTATAITGGIDYARSPLWKWNSRMEARLATASNTYLGTVAAAFKLNRDITLLGRDIYAMTDNKGNTGDKTQNRFQAGMAYRPVDTDTWNVLAKYEFKTEADGSVAGLNTDRSVNIFSTHYNFQPQKTVQLNGVYAFKFVKENSDNLASTSDTSMLGMRLLYDIRERWDIGMSASTLFGGLFRSNSYGLGVEVGYLVGANLWLSGGYNFFGYYDKDLTVEEYTNQGVYVRFRFKFDQDLFAGDDPAYNKTIIPASLPVPGKEAGR